jgi:hypothetical protein
MRLDKPMFISMGVIEEMIVHPHNGVMCRYKKKKEFHTLIWNDL